MRRVTSRVQPPVAFVIMVPICCFPGRKFRPFSLTIQRYENFRGLPNLITKKARKKAHTKKTCKMFVNVESFNYFCSVKY